MILNSQYIPSLGSVLLQSGVSMIIVSTIFKEKLTQSQKLKKKQMDKSGKEDCACKLQMLNNEGKLGVTGAGGSC